MDFSNYTDFFHDGSVIDIKNVGDKIEIFMKSAEIDREELMGEIALSKEDRIIGKLHIEGIESININKKDFLQKLTKKYDLGKIFDFEIKKNLVELSIDWVDFPPKPQVNEFSNIKIKAKKIYWENLPK